MGIHMKSIFFASGCASVAPDAFHSFDAPGSFVAIHADSIGGAFLCAKAAEDAVIDVDGHMTTGSIGTFSRFHGIHEGSRLTEQVSHQNFTHFKSIHG